MKNFKHWILRLLILISTIIYTISIFINLGKGMAEVLWTITISFFFLQYLVKASSKNMFFGLFLLSFIIAEITYFLYDENLLLIYYTFNICYILSYVFLLIHIVKDMEIKVLFKRFDFHLLILLGLSVYVLYESDKMLNYNNKNISLIDYTVETLYNMVVILTLALSLLHYLYFMTKKALLLFSGCFFLAFSEIIQIFYYFISGEYVLNIIFCCCLVMAFFLLYVYFMYEERNNTVNLATKPL